MGRYNEILVGRFNRFAQKLFSMKGPASLEALDPNLFFTLPLFHGNENRYLEAWDRYGRAFQVAAQGVNSPSGIHYRNPAVSNVVAVFENLAFSVPTSGVAVDVQLAIFPNETADLAGATPPNSLDKRGRPNSSVIMSTGTEAVFTAQDIDQAFASSWKFIVTRNQEVTLLPGMTLAMQHRLAAGNTAINFIATWRERLLEESERA